MPFRRLNDPLEATAADSGDPFTPVELVAVDQELSGDQPGTQRYVQGLIKVTVKVAH